MPQKRFAKIAIAILLACGVGACTQIGAGSHASNAEKTLLPAAAWDCAMPGGIPQPERGVLVLEAEVNLDAIYDVGRTPFGKRQVAVTQTGTITGPKIQGTVLPG